MSNEDKFAKTIDDDELDHVAGGTAKELDKDIAFLNEIGKDHGVSVTKNSTNFKILSTWRQFGVENFPRFDLEGFKNVSSEYRVEKENGETPTVSRQDAMIWAMRKAGKVVDLDKYL